MKKAITKHGLRIKVSELFHKNTKEIKEDLEYILSNGQFKGWQDQFMGFVHDIILSELPNIDCKLFINNENEFNKLLNLLISKYILKPTK